MGHFGRRTRQHNRKNKNLIEILSGKRPGFTDESSAATHLSELLADGDILIGIDDVCNKEVVQPLLPRHLANACNLENYGEMMSEQDINTVRVFISHKLENRKIVDLLINRTVAFAEMKPPKKGVRL